MLYISRCKEEDGTLTSDHEFDVRKNLDISDSIRIDSGMEIFLYDDPDGCSHCPLYVHLATAERRTDIFSISTDFEGYGNRAMMQIRDSSNGEWVLWNNSILNHVFVPFAISCSMPIEDRKARIASFLHEYIELIQPGDVEQIIGLKFTDILEVNSAYSILIDGEGFDHAFLVYDNCDRDKNGQVNIVHFIRSAMD